MTRVSARSLLALLALLSGLSLGCASYQGTARDVRLSTLAATKGWVIVPQVPLVLQEGTKDCGAAALSAVLAYWGKSATPGQVASAVRRPLGERLRAGELQGYARSRGLSAFVFLGTMKDLIYEVTHGRPVIVGVGKPYAEDKVLSHYEVVVGVDQAAEKILFLDPARGWRVDTFEGFAREWAASKAVTIVTFLPQEEASSG